MQSRGMMVSPETAKKQEIASAIQGMYECLERTIREGSLEEILQFAERMHGLLTNMAEVQGRVDLVKRFYTPYFVANVPNYQGEILSAPVACRDRPPTVWYLGRVVVTPTLRGDIAGGFHEFDEVDDAIGAYSRNMNVMFNCRGISAGGVTLVIAPGHFEIDGDGVVRYVFVGDQYVEGLASVYIVLEDDPRCTSSAMGSD